MTTEDRDERPVADKDALQRAVDESTAATEAPAATDAPAGADDAAPAETPSAA